MKIERVQLYHLRMPLQAPFETSFGRIETRDGLLVEAHAGGLVGYGECAADRDPGYSYETAATAWYVLKEFLVPAILNQEVASPQALQPRLAFVRGHPMAKAGLEMAYWDLWGKAQGRSLSQMLGGEHPSVAAGGSMPCAPSSARTARSLSRRASARALTSPLWPPQAPQSSAAACALLRLWLACATSSTSGAHGATFAARSRAWRAGSGRAATSTAAGSRGTPSASPATSSRSGACRRRCRSARRR